VIARNRADSPTTWKVLGVPAGKTTSPPGSTSCDVPSTRAVTRPSNRNSTPVHGETCGGAIGAAGATTSKTSKAPPESWTAAFATWSPSIMG
jgi:hypothetical protein